MKKLTYDAAISRLEEIVTLLENEKTPIEESLKLFKEGIELTHYCQKKLSDIEKEITIIQSNNQEEEKNDETGN